jgi:hydrogenase/urease accessory protein HupE
VHQTFVNVYEDGALRHQAILSASTTRLDYYTGTIQGRLAVVETFIPAGVEHILIGPDHVLFLVGLLLLGGTLWRLGAIVTAFTIGHSITLSLAALDVYSPPASLVEPLIALTIIVVGADNLLVFRSARVAGTAQRAAGGPKQRESADLRPWLAGAFGLIHGFGFAFVLKEFGLPRDALGWSLFSFNVGVEIGQLTIVIVVSGALAALARRSAGWASRVAWSGSIGVVLAGLYWFAERLWLG